MEMQSVGSIARKALGIVAVWGAVFCSSSHAETGIVGVGATSCAQLGDVYKRDSTEAEHLMTMYVQGYLSGLNGAQLMIAKASAMKDLDTPIESIINAIRLACDQRPTAYVYEIISESWRTIPPAKLKPQ